jgi:NADPH:quinone reductase-like Zn-dependent oxidoreductase
MYAVVIDDGELKWQERPDPVPGDHDIVVRVRGAGVNGADISQRAGRYPAPPGWPPDVPGLEMAGEVAATGPRVTRFRIGDRVMALVGGGAQAELALVDEQHALPVPAGLDLSEAGGFMEASATAYDALFDQAGVTLGDRVLVTGAAGGVGTAAVQLAAAAGAVVTASVRDTALHDMVAALGAAHVVTPGEVEAAGPYDVVLELVGAASLPSAFAALAVRGRVVVIGVGGGADAALDLMRMMGLRARLFASTLRSRSAGEKAVLVARLGEKVLPALAAGRLRVVVAAAYPLAEAPAAYNRFTAGGKVGKIVLTG